MVALGEETKLFLTIYLVSLNTRRKFGTLAPSSVYRPSVGENGWLRTLISTMYDYLNSERVTARLGLTVIYFLQYFVRHGPTSSGITSR